ncbi:transposase, partial [bacterium]|nr:transposase [bacterium]
GKSQLYLTPMHAAGRVIAAMIVRIRTGLQYVKHIAEQLPSRDRWELLVRYIVDRILASTQAVRQNQPALPAPAAG